MRKYAFLLMVLVQLAVAQNCFNCKTGSCTPTGCLQCENGFMLNSQGWCGIFTPIEGCRIYDASSTNKCQQCQDGRALIDSRCYLKPQNCEVSDKNRQCLTCRTGFTLFRGKCYTQQIQNCPRGSLPTSGYCQPLRAQNCQRATGDDKICDACDPGYSLINGRCLRVVSTAACPGSRCTCTNGFIFEQNCYQIRIDKCTINRDAIYCVACERGFVAIDGICLEPIKNDDVNCNVKAPLSDFCTGCNQDYFLNVDAFCYRNFNLTDCPTASGLFYLQNGKCLYRDRRCDAIDFRNNSFKCLRCQQGFTMTNGLCQRNICIRYSLDGICQQAFIGYGISGNNQYIQYPTNCLAVLPGTNRCSQCSSFTRNQSMSAAAGSEFVCAYYDSNCVEYNLNGSCVQCAGQALNDGYILKERFCYKKAENCARRDSNDLSKCIQCNAGFHVDQMSRTCYANVEGCQIYVSGSDCKQCTVQTYILFNRKCFPANNDCIDFDATNLCKRCSQGLMPFKNTCVFYHPYCVEYGADRVCSKAASGWALGVGMTEDQKTYYRSFMMRGDQIRNRNQMASLNGLYAGAGAGSYAQGALILNFPYANLIHTKINSVNMFGQVVSCKAGYTLTNQACIQKVTPNCQQYTLDQICIRCAPRYTLQGDFTCVEGLQCATPQDISNDRCLRCANGYILIGVQCFRVETKEVIDRWLMSSSFFRITLSNGYYIAWPRMANCRNQSNPVVCAECIAPYQNVQGQCIIPVTGCTNYGLVQGPSPGLCLSCEAGSALWFGQCRKLACTQYVNGICSSCPANYYYYFGYCLINAVNGCKIYDNGVCQLCGYGFYANLRGQCLQQLRGCLTTNRDTGRCLQCRSGLTLYRQSCVLQIMYCLDYDSNNRCTRCQSNTVNRTQMLGDGTCALLEGQCARVDEKTRECAECNLGYSPIRQDNRILCVSIRANCQVYDVRGRCTTCNPKFVLINNQCKIYLQYCLSFTADQTTCLSCAPGTVLDNGCCKVPDPFCISFSSCLCTGCMSGYFINDTGLCQVNPAGCQLFDRTTSICLKCATNYYLYNNTCVYRDYIINGCQQGYNLTYNQSNGYQCVKCVQGFELNPADNLCYGYNCAVRFQSTRHCVSCPPYYQIYRGSNYNDYQNYCIPYFCQTYLPGQDICLKNVTTYYGGHTIISTTRTIIIVYCASVDPATYKCTSCSNYRYANMNTLYGLCYPYHCASALQFNCNQCEFGYGLDARFPGSCIATFCNQWKADGSCLSCIAPYTLSSTGICENKGCCDQYDSQQNVCRIAKKYYTIQNGICVASMCLNLDSTKLSNCLQCARGFTLFPDGTCRVTNCQQDVFSGDSCITCNRGFRTQLSTTTAKAICVPRYCLDIAPDGNSCLKCAEGFTLDADKMCRADFCANFQTSLVCQTCMPFYVLNVNERCVADCSIGTLLRCQCCKYGASLNTTSGLCQPTQTYCAQNNPSNGICGTCVSGYALVSGQCVAPVLNCKTPSLFGCLSCNFGYEVVDNCRCVPRYCVQQKPDGSCSQCHPRFELTAEGLCKTRDCQYWVAQSWICNGCYSRFTFRDGMCITNDCAFWEDFQNSTCRVCKTNTYVSSTNFSQMISAEYELVYGACYIRYCKNDPRDFYCKQCKPGYKLTMNGLCECISFDASKNQCICPEGYIFNSVRGECELNRDVCLSRDQSTGRCLQCPYRYQLPADNQGECVPLYCDKWEVVAPRYIECRKCLNNFVLRDGFCQSSLCTKFQNKTGLLFPQCTACAAGWSPFSNFCVPSKCEPSTYSLLTGICAKCTSFGYVLSADKTRCIVANCQIELPPDQCSKCKTGYYNFTGLCLANNCSIFAQVTCNGCIDGFYLSNNLCYANNCDKYNDQIFCVQCAAGFQLAKNLTCIRQNCDADSKDKCLKCTRGFVWESSLRRCVPTNCQKYLPNYQQCEVCKQGYLKENGTCLDIYCDINYFTQEFICQKCAAGYEFNSQGLCYPINAGFCPPGKYYSTSQGGCIDIPTPSCRIFVDGKCMWCVDGFFLFNSLCYSTRFCSKFSYFFGCYECIQGYYLQNRQCKLYQSDPNCIQSRNNQCYTCKSGYQLIQGRCVFIPQNCLHVDSNGRCVRCATGYSLNSNSMCQITDTNCLSVDGQGRCSRCRDNYFINTQGMCQLNPNNCATVDTNGICSRCLAGYTLQNGRCFKSYSYCIRYSQSTEFCAECIQNFTLSGIECVCGSDSQLVLNQVCIKLPENCLQVAPSTYLCVRCARNYTLTSDFRCVKNTTVIPPDNCNIYDPATGICRECFPNYILVNNLCQMCPSGQIKVGNNCYIIIIGCSQYLPSGLCSVCQSGYRLQNGKCTAVNPPNFCQIYDPQTGICQKCIAGYSITSNGLQCVLNNCLTPSSDGRTCVKCIDTFSWSGRECRLESQFCISYFNGRCQSCQSFTYLNQSRCVPNNCKIYDYSGGVCTSCITNYQLAYRRCFLIIVGCNTYLQSGLCSVCAPGYNLVNGYCQKTVIDVPRFCDQFNQTIGVCVRCAPGYSPTIDGKLCILTNCELMDPTGQLCTRCVSPFQWSGQYCVFITDFCVTYSGGYCSSCLSFSSLQRNRCVPNYCSAYNYTTGVCEGCQSGYALSLKRCFIIIQYCVSYSESGMCAMCQSGYNIANGGASCQASSIPRCFSQFSSSVCNRCQHRYYVDSQMCSAYLPYCINIDPLGRCISCCFGSSLVNGTCVKDRTIKYCQNQAGNTCQQCQPNYSYCTFCDACLPVSPNCNKYDNYGKCLECFDNFVLLNSVCVSMPVGYVSGAAGTCRSGYYLNGNSCFRNQNQLRLYSSVRKTTSSSSAFAQLSSGSSSATTSMTTGYSYTYDAYVVKTEGEPLIIFGILVNTLVGNLPSNASFILYYKSKTNDPMICWNSCIPTKIDSRTFTKNLVHPIIATDVSVYLINQLQQNVGIDFKIL